MKMNLASQIGISLVNIMTGIDLDKFCVIDPEVEQILPRTEREWGYYTVCSEGRVLQDQDNMVINYKVKYLHFEMNKAIHKQYHLNRIELWTVLSGEGLVTINGIMACINKDTDAIVIHMCDEHKVVAITNDFVIKEIQLSYVGSDESDVVYPDPTDQPKLELDTRGKHNCELIDLNAILNPKEEN